MTDLSCMCLYRTQILYSRLTVPVVCCTDPATPEIYTLSLHDALPISGQVGLADHTDESVVLDDRKPADPVFLHERQHIVNVGVDRKSTRLNSSHTVISYAVFCLKKKNDHPQDRRVAREGRPRDAQHPG